MSEMMPTTTTARPRERARRLLPVTGAAIAALIAALAALVLPAGPAWAHNALAEASPAKDSTVTTAPAEVKLRFLQTLNPEYTTIAVSDAAKQKVATSEAKVDGSTGTVTFTAPPPNGEYLVAYRVVSKDGHTVQGSYKFTVNAAGAEPAPSAAAPSEAAPSDAAPSETAPSTAVTAEAAPSQVPVAGTAKDDGGFGTLGIVLVVAGLLVVGGIGFVLMRRGKA